MSYTFYIEPTINCIFYKFYGAYDTSVREQSVLDAINHPDFNKEMNILSDTRNQPIPSDISFKSITDEVRQNLKIYDRMLGKCRWATIVANAQSYAKVHQFIVTGRLGSHQVERKPFRNIEKARKWLGIPADYKIKHHQDTQWSALQRSIM